MNKNIGKFIRALILVVWAILFGQLLSRDYFVKTLDIRESQAIQRGREESFLGIYFKQERIGYVKNRMVKKDNGRLTDILTKEKGKWKYLAWSESKPNNNSK